MGYTVTIHDGSGSLGSTERYMAYFNSLQGRVMTAALGGETLRCLNGLAGFEAADRLTKAVEWFTDPEVWSGKPIDYGGLGRVVLTRDELERCELYLTDLRESCRRLSGTIVRVAVT